MKGHLGHGWMAPRFVEQTTYIIRGSRARVPGPPREIGVADKQLPAVDTVTRIDGVREVQTQPMPQEPGLGGGGAQVGIGICTGWHRAPNCRLAVACLIASN